MEAFSILKIPRSKIPLLLHNPHCFTHSKKKSIFNTQSNFNFRGSFHHIKDRGLVLNSSYDESGSITQHGLENIPLTVELVPITSESQFDQVVVAEAQQLEEPLVVLWMAGWCRKCIYLKPKLEKLAADYFPRISFYSIDVNNVPHKLVVRAGVTKMPTIQLWKDGKKQAEVIGGHRAYLVVNEVREMIENEISL